MMRNRTETYFIGKLNYILSRNPDIQDIHSLAIQALHNQNHSDLNEFYLDVAIAKLRAKKEIIFKKVIQENKTLSQISLAA